MTPERLFSILNAVALVGWLPLVFLPRMRWSASVVPLVVPLVLGVVYVALVAFALPGSEGNFSSLAGVRALFENPWGLLAGWTHYRKTLLVRRVRRERRRARAKGAGHRNGAGPTQGRTAQTAPAPTAQRPKSADPNGAIP